MKEEEEVCSGDFCTGYRGILSTTNNGHQCRLWTEYSEYDQQKDIFGENYLMENYCRNPNKDPKGAWCMVSNNI